MDRLFITTIGLGLAFCATPGAVNTESLRRGLARGFRAAVLVQLGSLIGDVTWATIALTGTAFLVQNGAMRLLLGIAGACFLLRLAWSALKDARHGSMPEARTPAARNDFMTGAFFSLTNPFAVAFWLGIGGGMIAATTAHPHPREIALFLGGFMVGAVLWCLICSAAITWGRRFIRAGLFRWINAFCGLTLGYFSLSLLWKTLQAVRFVQALRLLSG